MPEGPEVRKFADALDAALTGRAIVSFEARTKEARKWSFCAGCSNTKTKPIGAALLNQSIVAGLGNYLRAEVLFSCKLNPWRIVGELTQRNLNCLSITIPRLTRDAYERGATAADEDRKRMASDPSLVYQPGRDYGTRHLVFRRTNLPCLRCGGKIRQLRQKTMQNQDDEEERTRIVYFCATCQKVEAAD